jgi:hypothetical protein
LVEIYNLFYLGSKIYLDDKVGGLISSRVLNNLGHSRIKIFRPQLFEYLYYESIAHLSTGDGYKRNKGINYVWIILV